MYNWFTDKKVKISNRVKGGNRHNDGKFKGFITYLIILVLLIAFIKTVNANELKSENDYVQTYCRGYPGDSRPLQDGTRPDCIWDDYAIEYDWATFKWYECITQAKWYAMNTGRRAGCVLISEHASDDRYVNRAKRLIMHYNEPVTLWILRNGKFIEVSN